jgi:hypothetical protein
MTWAQAGQLDTTFTTKGIFLLNPIGQQGGSTRVALQTDGKIVLAAPSGDLAAGQAGKADPKNPLLLSPGNLALSRYSAGKLDTTFGSGGTVQNTTYERSTLVNDEKILGWTFIKQPSWSQSWIRPVSWSWNPSWRPKRQPFFNSLRDCAELSTVQNTTYERSTLVNDEKYIGPDVHQVESERHVQRCMSPDNF